MLLPLSRGITWRRKRKTAIPKELPPRQRLHCIWDERRSRYKENKSSLQDAVFDAVSRALLHSVEPIWRLWAQTLRGPQIVPPVSASTWKDLAPSELCDSLSCSFLAVSAGVSCYTKTSFGFLVLRTFLAYGGRIWGWYTFKKGERSRLYKFHTCTLRLEKKITSERQKILVKALTELRLQPWHFEQGAANIPVSKYISEIFSPKI